MKTANPQLIPDTPTLQGRSIDEFFNEQFGYGVSQLADHLERQFTDGMDWRRFAAGEIHIDHKSLMIMFGVENNTHLRNCFALNNLQPLWASDNAAKNSMCDLTGHRFRREVLANVNQNLFCIK